MGPLTRRDFARLAMAGLAGGLVPSRPARALPGADEKKFLFVFAKGGWDPCFAFAPMFDVDIVEGYPDSEPATVGGLPFVHADDRPAVTTFFENQAHRTCIINGLEVPSIAHPRCTELLFTGQAGGVADDFPSIIAGHSQANLQLPHIVLSGPAYVDRHTSQVVRVGRSGQLRKLYNGVLMDNSDLLVAPPVPSVDEVVDQFVRDRTSAYAQAAGIGRAQRHGQTYQRVLEQMAELDANPSVEDMLSVSDGEAIRTGMEFLATGMARTALVMNEGQYNATWDTHSANNDQNWHYQLLFEELNLALAEAENMTSPSGAPLLEELVVVIVSEMGRDPRLNATKGKHHWTWTSALLLGAGISGGRVIGGFDEYMTGMPIDLASGELDEGGQTIGSADLGATLLALADVDPAEYLDTGTPIEGILA